MEERFGRASRFLSAVGAGLGVTVAHQANQWLAEHKVADPVLILVAIAIVVLGSELLRWLFDHWLIGWRLVRRALLGTHYVEGTWLDAMSKDGKIMAIGVTRIEPDGQSIIISGEDFDPNGRFRGRYNTSLHTLGWPCLGYMYRYHRSDDASIEARGLVEMQFEPRNGPPVRYSGDYFDPADGRRVTFEGWRIKDREMLRNLDDPAKRLEAVQKFWACAQVRLKTVSERDRLSAE